MFPIHFQTYHGRLARRRKWRACDVGEAKEGAHSPTFPSLHLRHSSFSNPSVALPMSQLILQPFRCFTYVTAHTPTLLSLLIRHRLFTYVTWRATHEIYSVFLKSKGNITSLCSRPRWIGKHQERNWPIRTLLQVPLRHIWINTINFLGKPNSKRMLYKASLLTVSHGLLKSINNWRAMALYSHFFW